MSLLINIQQLQRNSSSNVRGEIEVADLGIVGLDECISPGLPLKYNLEVTMTEDGILMQGSLEITVKLTCVRCLTESEKCYRLESWTGYGALNGEDALPVESDCVDLTPVIREDILLAFPLHPTCEGGCKGTLRLPVEEKDSNAGSQKDAPAASVWRELDKLKL
jgi:uncharacterized metal-binding protein YceD (DUF177 family)